MLQLDFYNYGLGETATVVFDDSAPTQDGGVVAAGPAAVFIGGDSSGGNKDLDGTATYTLAFAGATQPSQGFHVRVTVTIDGRRKSKEFFVENCTSTSPTSTEPTTAPTTDTTTDPTTRAPNTMAPSDDFPSEASTQPPISMTRPVDGVPTAVDAGLADGSAAATPSTDPTPSSTALTLVGATTGLTLVSAGAVSLLRRRRRDTA